MQQVEKGVETPSLEDGLKSGTACTLLSAFVQVVKPPILFVMPMQVLEHISKIDAYNPLFCVHLRWLIVVAECCLGKSVYLMVDIFG